MSSPKYTLAELRNLQEDDELDLSACGIKEFPTAIVQLTRLTKLDLSSNSLLFLPETFCKMSKIVRLDFGSNQLHHLPDGIGLLTNLQHLNLYNNKLEDLPLSFANLKSLKWLDLKKNPLNSELLAIAGNCGTDAECKNAAKKVVDVYMGERKKAVDVRKAQEAKMNAKVQKAKEEEKIRKHQEKKRLKELNDEKDAKHREAASAAKAHHQQHAEKKAPKNQKDSSPKNRKEEVKKTQKSRGLIGGLFHFIWSCIWYTTIALLVASTIAIGLDCRGTGSQVHGNKPLCKDISLLASATKPSPQFVQNLKTSYGSVLTGYHNQAKPHLAPVQKWTSKQWNQFVKTDIGKKVEQVLYKIHAFIVDVWVKVQRFVVKQWNTVVAWWKKDGQKQFGPAIDGFLIGLKMVFNVVVDVGRNISSILVHFAIRVKTFFLALSDGGFNAAMNTLNH